MFEKNAGFRLSDALTRANENKGRLFRGYSIYVTEAIHGGFKTYKSIIEVNGGTCLMYRARAGSSLTSRMDLDEASNESDSSQPEYVYLVSGTSHEEAKLWPKFRQMVTGSGKEPRIVSNNWLLDTALSQQHQWKDIYSLTDKQIGALLQ